MKPGIYPSGTMAKKKRTVKKRAKRKGRPVIAPENRRTEQVIVYCTDEEKEAMREVAESQHRDLSSCIRLLMLREHQKAYETSSDQKPTP